MSSPGAALECDYLVIGSGAMGLAFADTLVKETRGHQVIIVDQHAAPGGHWNDAYPFVTLHQPSHYYGVNSRRLERAPAPRAGKVAELASSQEILAYYCRVMEDLQGTGRVRYMPRCRAEEDGRRIVSLIDPGLAWEVAVRKKVVDAAYMQVRVPSTRPPPYAVAEGALVVPPNRLPSVAAPCPKYVVIGSGKTGIDTVLWLLGHGASPERLDWVMPREAWFWNRAVIQPGMIAGSLVQMGKAIAEAQAQGKDHAELVGMERVGALLRLDEGRWPEAWRCATVSTDELAELRRVRNLVCMGHVREVGVERLLLDGGELTTGPGTLHVDCTADGLAKRPTVPIFQKGRATLQPVSMCQQVFSAALLAHLEARWPDDDAKKNQLSVPVPHPTSIDEYSASDALGDQNMKNWIKNGCLGWLVRSRLWLGSHESKMSLLLFFARDLLGGRREQTRGAKSAARPAAAPASKL